MERKRWHLTENKSLEEWGSQKEKGSNEGEKEEASKWQKEEHGKEHRSKSIAEIR